MSRNLQGLASSRCSFLLTSTPRTISVPPAIPFSTYPYLSAAGDGGSRRRFDALARALSRLLPRKRRPSSPERMADSLFFPDRYPPSPTLKRRDYLQLFGDRSAGKLEPPWRAVFFGSDDFSVAILKQLHGSALSLFPGEGLLEVLHVCTTCPAQGSKSKENPVHRYAKRHGFTIVPYPIPPERPLTQYDVGLLASFGHLVPGRVIRYFPYGILNVHPSVLPRWRGASPCLHTVLNGDTETGVSIMQVAPRHFDIGPVVAQLKFPMPSQPLMTGQLNAWMAREGGSLLLETLERLPKLIHKPMEQPRHGITYAHKIRAENGRVDWRRSLASEIYRQFLALGDGFGLHSLIGDLKVTFLDVHDASGFGIDSLIRELHPGSHFYHKPRKLLCVRCSDGWIAFSRVKLKGKKSMSAADFYNGYLSKPPLSDQVFQSLPNFLNENVFDSRVRRNLRSPLRDGCVNVTYGHDCLLSGKHGKRFVAVH